MCSTVHVCLWANEWASVVHIARHIDKLGLLSAPFHFTPFSFRQHFCYQFDSDSFVQVYISMWWQPTCIVIKVATFLSRQMFKLKQHTFKKNSFAYFISSNSIFLLLQFHLFFYDYFCSVSWFISLSFHITFKLTRWLNNNNSNKREKNNDRKTNRKQSAKQIFASNPANEFNWFGLVLFGWSTFTPGQKQNRLDRSKF